MNKLFRTLLVVALFSVAAFGQSALTVTTLSAALAAPTPNNASTTFTIASATGWSASTSTATYYAYADQEAMKVTAISSTTVTVQRGVAGKLSGHLSGEAIYFGQVTQAAGAFLNTRPVGTCTASAQGILPKISFSDGSFWDCQGGKWFEINGPGGVYVETHFCGDLANNTANYFSPIDGYPAGNALTAGLTANDLSYGIAGTGCSAEDSTTEATADEVMYANNDMYAVGMSCTVTGSGSNGLTLSVRDDAAELTPPVNVTIATAITTGATRKFSPIKIAAGSTVAVKALPTEDLSAQDAYCTVRFQIAP